MGSRFLGLLGESFVVDIDGRRVTSGHAVTLRGLPANSLHGA
jgi:hypothetical protein